MTRVAYSAPGSSEFDPTVRGYFYEEWLGSVTVGTEGFSSSVSGTGAAISVTNATTQQSGENEGRPGVMVCSTGTTTTGRANVYGNHLMMNFGDGSTTGLKVATTYKQGIKIPTLSDGTDTFSVGFGLSVQQTTVATRKTGAYFVYDSTSSANWLCVTDDNGTAETTTTTTAVDTNWHDFMCIIAADHSTAMFYIDGTLVATNTANIPSTRTFNTNCGIYKSAGTNNREVFNDYQYIQWDYDVSRQGI